jgi:chemotaxis protein CheX
MSNAILPADICQYASRHLAEVFDTMLSMKAVPSPAATAQSFQGERVTGTVGMAGEKVTGQVYVHLTAPLAAQATAAMLGMDAAEVPGESEVNDVIGEVTNMVAGGLKSWLCDNGAICALTTPAVIRGTSFNVTPKPGVELLTIGFECQSVSGLMEIHIKFN